MLFPRLVREKAKNFHLMGAAHFGKIRTVNKYTRNVRRIIKGASENLWCEEDDGSRLIRTTIIRRGLGDTAFLKHIRKLLESAKPDGRWQFIWLSSK